MKSTLVLSLSLLLLTNSAFAATKKSCDVLSIKKKKAGKEAVATGVDAPFDMKGSRPEVNELPMSVQKAVNGIVVNFIVKYKYLPDLADVVSRLKEKDADLLEKFGFDRATALREIKDSSPDGFFRLQTFLVNKYTALAAKYRRIPTSKEIADSLGIKEKQLNELLGENGLFKDLQALKEKSKKDKETQFVKIIDTDLYGADHVQAAVKEVAKVRPLLVSSFIAGVPVIKEQLLSMITLAKEKNAAIILMAVQGRTFRMDPFIEQMRKESGVPIFILAGQGLQITHDILLAETGVIPTKANAIATFEHKVHTLDSSIIFASSTYIYQPVPTFRTETTRRFLGTPGSISEGNYSADRFAQTTAEGQAVGRHFNSAMLLEPNPGFRPDIPNVRGVGDYNIRQIRYTPENQSVADLNQIFYANGRVETAEILGLNIEDHVVAGDRKFQMMVARDLKGFNVRELLHEDWIDGNSINPHIKEETLSLAKRGSLTLEKEVEMTVSNGQAQMEQFPGSVHIIKPANHVEWVIRYLKSGAYMKDPANLGYSVKLLNAMNMSKDPFWKDPLGIKPDGTGWANPFEFAVMEKLSPAQRKRIVFLDYGQNYVIGPDFMKTDTGDHGDVGVNGSKGGPKAYLKSAASQNKGHHHYTLQINDHAQNGTATPAKQDYSRRGPSMLDQSVTATTANGGKQILQNVNGRLYTRPSETKGIREGFFRSGFPHAAGVNDAESISRNPRPK
ncbi:MAG: hypothetical protein AB7F59_11470 [Bdellovibrionales bacterium]